MKRHYLLYITLFVLLIAAGMGYPWLKKAFNRQTLPTRYIAYMGRFTNFKDSLPPEKQEKNKFDLLHEHVLKDYISSLNDQQSKVHFELKSFDCRKDPLQADSLYKVIAQDSSIVAVIDNTWGIHIGQAANTIKTNKIPVIAINADKNNLDFGSTVIFTGNNDNMPFELAVYLSKAMKVKQINLISEVDYPVLHTNFLSALERENIKVLNLLSLEGKKESKGADSVAFFSQLAQLVAQPGFENQLLVINAHAIWGNDILDFIDGHCRKLSLLGHAYITNEARLVNFGKHNNNELILITDPTDALSQKLSLDLEHYRQLHPDIFQNVNAPLFLKRCQDATEILRHHIDAPVDSNTNYKRADFQEYIKALADTGFAGSSELYTFDSAHIVLKAPNFTHCKGGKLFSMPVQLNQSNNLIPNLIFGMEIQDIYDLDISSNSFNADFYYWIKVDTHHTAAEKFISFQNLKQSESSTQLIIEKTEGEMLYRLYRASGKFYVNYHLEDFPFDKQEIVITVEILNPDDHLKISFDQSSLNKESTSLEKFKVTGWDKLKYYVTVDNKITASMKGDPEAIEGKLAKFKIFSFRLNVQRHFWGSLLQIILPLILIGLVSIALLYLQDLSFGNVGEVSVGTFLGIIAFSISLSEIIPTSNTLTRADILFWLTFVVVFVSFMSTIVLNSIYTADQVNKVKLKKLRIFITVLYPALVAYTLLGQM